MKYELSSYQYYNEKVLEYIKILAENSAKKIAKEEENIFLAWLSIQDTAILNYFDSDQEILNYISTQIRKKKECLVTCVVGPSFLRSACITYSLDGWKNIINDAGAKILSYEIIATKTIFNNIVDKVISHWDRIDPYRDKYSLSYLRICTFKIADNGGGIKNKDVFIEKNTALNCSKYQKTTRRKLKVYYLVHFFQDLAFLRGLVSRHNIDDVKIIINNDNMAQHHLLIIDKFLLNRGLSYDRIADFNFSAVSSGDVFMTSTLGPESPMHLSCSRFITKLRDLEVITVTLQHGLTLPNVFLTLTEYTWMWNCYARDEVKKRLHPLFNSTVYSVENVRPIIKKSDKLIKIFGKWISYYSHYVMIATNLHWQGVHGVDSRKIVDFIKKLSELHPKVIFFIRPHPEDFTMSGNDFAPNVLIIDDIITGLLDVSIDEILANCDALISTYSTLLYDAARHGVRFAVFEHNQKITKDSLLYPELDNVFYVGDIDNFDLFNFLNISVCKKIEYKNNTSFCDALLALYNKNGTPLAKSQLHALDNLCSFYKKIAPDYGRKQYVEKIENAFLRGLS